MALLSRTIAILQNVMFTECLKYILQIERFELITRQCNLTESGPELEQVN